VNMRRVLRSLLVVVLVATAMLCVLPAAEGNSGAEAYMNPGSLDGLVYRTKTGVKYHRSNCFYLSRSKISLTLAHALDMSLTPCSYCRPDAGIEVYRWGEVLPI
jgi:hypothetical protein